MLRLRRARSTRGCCNVSPLACARVLHTTMLTLPICSPHSRHPLSQDEVRARHRALVAAPLPKASSLSSDHAELLFPHRGARPSRRHQAHGRHEIVKAQQAPPRSLLDATRLREGRRSSTRSRPGLPHRCQRMADDASRTGNPLLPRSARQCLCYQNSGLSSPHSSRGLVPPRLGGTCTERCRERQQAGALRAPAGRRACPHPASRKEASGRWAGRPTDSSTLPSLMPSSRHRDADTVDYFRWQLNNRDVQHQNEMERKSDELWRTQSELVRAPTLHASRPLRRPAVELLSLWQMTPSTSITPASAVPSGLSLASQSFGKSTRLCLCASPTLVGSPWTSSPSSSPTTTSSTASAPPTPRPRLFARWTGVSMAPWAVRGESPWTPSLRRSYWTTPRAACGPPRQYHLAQSWCDDQIKEGFLAVRREHDLPSSKIKGGNGTPCLEAPRTSKQDQDGEYKGAILNPEYQATLRRHQGALPKSIDCRLRQQTHPRSKSPQDHRLPHRIAEGRRPQREVQRARR